MISIAHDIKIFFMILFMILFNTCATYPFIIWLGASPGISESGTITDTQISEASGLAHSVTEKDLLWIINDSGNSSLVFAVNTRGEHLGSLEIQGIKNRDWEDIASFIHNGIPYLLISETGDNRGRWESYFLYIIKEPNLSRLPKSGTLSVWPEQIIGFTYEDGPRDCEAVAVDSKQKRILLLSKQDRPPVLYELPLMMGKHAVMTAKRLGQIHSIPQPSEAEIKKNSINRYSGLPTGMDISTDGKWAAILTYRYVYLYSADKRGDWYKIFSDTPKIIRLPLMRQAEAVCFAPKGNVIYVTSEKIPAPLIVIHPDKDTR